MNLEFEDEGRHAGRKEQQTKAERQERRRAGAAGAKVMVGRGRAGMETLAPLKKESSRALNLYTHPSLITHIITMVKTKKEKEKSF